MSKKIWHSGTNPQPDNSVAGYATTSQLRSAEENWVIAATTVDPENEQPLELILIHISLPNGKTWSGTIQDFAAIFSIAQNVFELIDTAPTLDWDGAWGVERRQCAIELENLLSHLK